MERVLFTLTLGEQHTVTGFTRHYGEGTLLPPPASLAICTFGVEAEYYLLYFGSDGEEQTDTLHESVSQAMEQARLEFGVRPDEWVAAEQA